MSNILNHNRYPFTFRMDMSQYWDFFIGTPDYGSLYSYGGNGSFSERCLSSYIDFNDGECVWFDDIFSKNGYVWENAHNDGLDLKNIGYTGVDNGLIQYKRDRISNEDFIKLFTESEYKVNEEDLRLKMTKVNGNNGIFDYDCNISETDGIIAGKFNGGFYQGFFRSGCEYQVLPSVLGEGFSMEFVLKPEDFGHEEGKFTLNDRHPSNKGIFFYIGTRAENKWWEKYETDESFERIYNTYFADDYVEDAYLYTIYNNNKYFLDVDDEDTSYNTNCYSDGHCEKCKCCDEEEESEDERTFDFNFTYPEALNTYEQNSKWFDGKGGVWIENEDWTSRIPKRKEDEKKRCRCGYFSDEYLEECCDENCDKKHYVEEQYYKPETEINPDEELLTRDGIVLYQPNIVEITSDNKFLMFDRTKDGIIAKEWEEGTEIVLTDVRASQKENYFLLFDRTCNGKLAKDFDNRSNKSYNVKSDLYRNAFALQVNEDGSVCYKYLTQDCDSEEEKIKIESEKTVSGLVNSGNWSTIHVKIIPLGKVYSYDTINTSIFQKMRILIYVNGKLALYSKELPIFNFKELNDTPDKQEGVPFSMSLGGGTQGLSDVVYYNFSEMPKYVLPLEEYFGGSFNGYIKSFKFYTCPQTFSEIKENADYWAETLSCS